MPNVEGGAALLGISTNTGHKGPRYSNVSGVPLEHTLPLDGYFSHTSPFEMRVTPSTFHVDTISQIPSPEGSLRYIVPSSEGRRINLRAKEIEATKQYSIEGISRLLMNPEDTHPRLMENKGFTSREQLKNFLLDEKDGVFLNKNNDIALPNPHIRSNEGYFGSHIYYWDSAPHLRLVLNEPTPEKIELGKGMIDNFEYLLDRLGYIPNGTNLKIANCSQPPLLTTMIRDVYGAMVHEEGVTETNKDWYKEKMEVAKREYRQVWMEERDGTELKQNAHHHTVPGTKLARYGDTDAGYELNSARESGEDLSPRPMGLAVDLNAKLALYESHFEEAARLFGNDAEADMWKDRKEARVAEMNEKMWDPVTGFYYDYDYKNDERSKVRSLAGFTPMWAGITTPEQDAKLVSHLPDFVQPYGVTITTKEHPVDPEKGIQWAYPNDFAIRKQQLVDGLIAKGFEDEAINIMERSIIAYAEFYKKYQTLPEKIDAVTGRIGDGAVYPAQVGFGWTRATYLDFVTRLPSLYEKRQAKRRAQETRIQPVEQTVYAA